MADLVFSGRAASTLIGAELQPENIDMIIYQGDDFNFIFSIGTDNDPNNLADLTGYFGRCYFKKNYADIEPIVASVTTIDSTHLNVALNSVQTAQMIDSYIYDLELTSPAGKVNTFMTGDVTVVPEVTK